MQRRGGLGQPVDVVDVGPEGALECHAGGRGDRRPTGDDLGERREALLLHTWDVHQRDEYGDRPDREGDLLVERLDAAWHGSGTAGQPSHLDPDRERADRPDGAPAEPDRRRPRPHAGRHPGHRRPRRRPGPDHPPTGRRSPNCAPSTTAWSTTRRTTPCATVSSMPTTPTWPPAPSSPSAQHCRRGGAPTAR